MPVVPVFRPVEGVLGDVSEAFGDDGILENSGSFSGLTSEEARAQMNEHAKAYGFGEKAITFRIKDWGVSRQRYWGTPIPVIHCEKCGLVPVPEADLPVTLPLNVEITGKGKSPLAEGPEFVNVRCPQCGGAAGRPCSGRLSSRPMTPLHRHRRRQVTSIHQPLRPERGRAA